MTTDTDAAGEFGILFTAVPPAEPLKAETSATDAARAHRTGATPALDHDVIAEPSCDRWSF